MKLSDMNLNRKIPPPIIAITAGVLMYFISDVSPELGLPLESKKYLILLLLLVGVFFDVHALLLFKRNQTTVNPLVKGIANTLVVEGIYKLTRNPMYVGMVFFLLAWATYLNTILPLVVLGLFIIYLTKFQIIPEEQALESIFGDEYRQYIASTRRWL